MNALRSNSSFESLKYCLSNCFASFGGTVKSDRFSLLSQAINYGKIGLTDDYLPLNPKKSPNLFVVNRVNCTLTAR